MARKLKITENENLWIAQRQGRAKDSNDRTQDSVLKMMAMAGEGDVTERLKELNIVPLAINSHVFPSWRNACSATSRQMLPVSAAC